MAKKCDGCKKRRSIDDLLRCACCDGLFCIVGESPDTCADRHECS